VKTTPPSIAHKPQWDILLRQAVEIPGTLNAAYSAFRRFSFLNTLLVMIECATRGIPIGTIETFKGWIAKGRCVRKGQQALSMWLPVMSKRSRNAAAGGDPSEQESSDDASAVTVKPRFLFVKRWFVLSQTDGEPLPVLESDLWDYQTALKALNIDEMPFANEDGNMLGYAKMRAIAINPLGPDQHRVRFHEIAHIQLGHTAQGACADGSTITKEVKELQAESVAMLCCASLGLPGVDGSRAYIQAWFGTNTIPAENCKRIFAATEAILRAGYPEEMAAEAKTAPDTADLVGAV